MQGGYQENSITRAAGSEDKIVGGNLQKEQIWKDVDFLTERGCTPCR
jgi:hypothetical protein